MNMIRNIGIICGLIGAPMLIIAQISILTDGNLSFKQLITAILGIFIALYLLLKIITELKNKKVRNEKLDNHSAI